MLVANQLDEVLPLIKRLQEASTAGLHAAGYLAYEAAPAFDAAAKVKAPNGKQPLALFGLFNAPSWGFGPTTPQDARYQPWELDTDYPRYEQQIEAIRQAICRGDTYQINHTLRAHSRLDGDGYALYQKLRRGQRAEYCAWLDCDDFQVLSLSPELFFKQEGNLITTRPMKGTARRGQMPEEDQALAQWLQESRKNRAENLMIVDLLRNDLSRLSQPGGVSVPALFTIERYPTVLQMTSTVRAEIKPETTLEQLFTALFPCGSITGAPKLKSMEIIANLEDSPRGVYCGAIGFIEPNGNSIFNVAIRTLTLDTKSGQLECGLGGGITWDSTPREEFEEVNIKAQFLTRDNQDPDLIETLRLEQGEYAYLELHLDRLEHSSKALGFPFNRSQTQKVLQSLSAAQLQGTFRVRLLHSKNGHDWIEALPLEPNPTTPVTVRLAENAVHSSNPALTHKTTERSVYEAAMEDMPKTIFDVLLWNERGELTEFTRGNLVVELDGVRYTPPLSCGLLAGVFRQHLLDQKEIVERVVTCEDLDQASKVWFVNSVRDWVLVSVDA